MYVITLGAPPEILRGTTIKPGNLYRARAFWYDILRMRLRIISPIAAP